jgi:hypothetical protein
MGKVTDLIDMADIVQIPVCIEQGFLGVIYFNSFETIMKFGAHQIDAHQFKKLLKIQKNEHR